MLDAVLRFFGFSFSVFLVFFFIFAAILTFIALVHALLRARQPQAALGWVLAIIFIPYAGAITYLIFGVNRVDSRAARLLRKVVEARQAVLQSGQITISGIASAAEIRAAPADILNVGVANPSAMLLLGGNNFTPLVNGENAYPVMLEAINKAQKEVFLCTYIFQGKRYAQDFSNALLAAKKRGVDVRLLVDGIGVFPTWNKPWRHLHKEGVKVAHFLSPHLLPFQFSINLRNHRKVLVADEVAFTGGMNVDDAHVVHDTPNVPAVDATDDTQSSFTKSMKGKVQDLHFCVEGPVVLELREGFLMDWAFCTGETDAKNVVFPTRKGNMDARVILDGPGTPSDTMLDLFCGVISCARKRVMVFTPYFLPPQELVSAFNCAVARGVEVTIVLSEELDHHYLGWATDHVLPVLLSQGVRIFRQPPPFAHTKLLLIDDEYVNLGSTNLDPRSLSLNFEMNVEVFSKFLNQELTVYAEKVLANCYEVTEASLENLSFLKRVRNAATWIFSPYL